MTINNMYARAGEAFQAGAPLGASWNVAQVTTSRQQATQAGAAFGLANSAPGVTATNPGFHTAPQTSAQRWATSTDEKATAAVFSVINLLNAPVRKLGDLYETNVRYVSNALNGEANPVKGGLAMMGLAGPAFLALTSQDYRDEWNTVGEANASPMQTLWLAGKSRIAPDATAPAEDPFRLLDDRSPEARAEYFGSGTAKWVTGVGDLAINLFNDPLIIGGKLAGLARTARNTVKATDVTAAASGATNLTRGGRRIDSIVNRVSQAFEDASSEPGMKAALTQMPWIRQSTDAGAITYAMGRLDRIADPVERMAARKELLYAGMGHRPSLAALEAKDRILALEIEDLTGPNREFARMELLLRQDIDHLNNLRAVHEDDWVDRVVDAHMDDIRTQREAYQRVHAVGSPAGLSGDALQATTGVGELATLPDFMRIGHTIHKGLGVPPVHMLFGRKLPGMFNLSADDAYQSFASAVMRTAGRREAKAAVASKYRSMLDEFGMSYGAANPAAARATRREIVDRFNRQASEDIVAKYSFGDPQRAEAIRAFILKVRSKRTDEMVNVMERTQRAIDVNSDSIHVIDDSGVIQIATADAKAALSTPFGGTQLQDVVSIPDYAQIERFVKSNFANGTEGFVRRAADGTWQFTDELLIAADQLWKFGALFRPGYVTRNLVDNQARNFAMLGIVDSLKNMARGSANLRYNRGRILASDVERLARISNAQTRISMIDDSIREAGRYVDNAEFYRVDAGAERYLLPSEKVGGLYVAPRGVDGKFTTRHLEDYQRWHNGDVKERWFNKSPDLTEDDILDVNPFTTTDIRRGLGRESMPWMTDDAGRGAARQILGNDEFEALIDRMAAAAKRNPRGKREEWNQILSEYVEDVDWAAFPDDMDAWDLLTKLGGALADIEGVRVIRSAAKGADDINEWVFLDNSALVDVTHSVLRAREAGVRVAALNLEREQMLDTILLNERGPSALRAAQVRRQIEELKKADFHGSRWPIESLTSPEDSARGVYGYGFYTTDSGEMAVNYARNSVKRPLKTIERAAPEQPSVYAVRWMGDNPPRVLDLSQPAPPWLRETIGDIFRTYADPGRVEELIRLVSNPSLTAGDAIKGLNLMKTLPDDAFRQIRQIAGANGFDAMRVSGSKLGPMHKGNVLVYLDVNNIRLEDAASLKAEVDRLTGELQRLEALGDDGLGAMSDDLFQTSLRLRQAREELAAMGRPMNAKDRIAQQRLKNQIAEMKAGKSSSYVRKGRTTQARHIGMEGERPAFRDAGEYARFMDTGSARESVLGLLAPDASRVLGDMRSSGQWQSIAPSNPGWSQAYLDLVNNRVRNDAGLMKIIAGADDATLRKFYLDDPEGMTIWAGMKSRYPGGVDELIAVQRQQVDLLLPSGEIRSMAMGGNITEGMIDDAFRRAEKPGVPMEMLDTAFKNPMEALVGYFNRTRSFWFKWAGEIPETTLGRLPFYVNRKSGHLNRLWPVDDAGNAVNLTKQQVDELYKRSDILAKRDVANYLFDTAQRSNLSAHLKFFSPFYSAWSDTMRKWTRIAGYNPAVIPLGAKAFMAPNSMFTVVDNEGNQILVNGDVVNSNGEVIRQSSDPTEGYIILPLPSFIAKWAGSDDSVRMAKSALNVTFQGEPFWLPSTGPLVTIPANYAATHYFPDLVDNPVGKYILPYGPEPNTAGMAFPMWMRNFWTLMNAQGGDYSESRLAQTFGQMLASKAGEIERGESAPMTQGELLDYAGTATRNWWIIRFFSNWTGFTVQPNSKLDFYVNEYRRYRREYGSEAIDKFYEDYPDYFEATISLSTNETGIAATDDTWDASQRYRSDITHNPDYGWMYVGAANLTAGFSEGVYTAQQVAGWRQVKNPVDAYKDTQVAAGWKSYQRFSDALQQELEARGAAGGPVSITAAANADLKQIRDQFMGDLKADNPEWANVFDRGGTSSSIGEFFRAAATAVEDNPELADRGDFVSLDQYLRVREEVRAELDYRGLATLDSPGAEDLAEIWAQFTTDLVASDLGFEQMWNRGGLDRDRVARGVVNGG